MNRIFARIFTMSFVAMSVCLCAGAVSAEENVPPGGFKALFNGKDLTGWYGCSLNPYKLAEMSAEERKKTLEEQNITFKEHWSVENGELVNDGKGAYATSDKDYGNFELWVDYKTVPLADSGIYLRGLPQVQIWDYTEAGGKWNLGANFGSGGLWNNSKDNPGKNPLVLADKPFGEWNRFRIIMKGERVTIWLNDKLVVDNAVLENLYKRGQPLPERGPIQLQTHGGEIRWKNIFIKELD